MHREPLRQEAPQPEPLRPEPPRPEPPRREPPRREPGASAPVPAAVTRTASGPARAQHGCAPAALTARTAGGLARAARGCAWAAVAGLLAAACGTTTAGAFHPAGRGGAGSAAAGQAAGTGAAGTGAAGTGATGAAGVTGGAGVTGAAGRGAAIPLAWPPFGRNVRIHMPAWHPADGPDAAAVAAAQDFLLAVLYAEYRGNQDDRWTGYAAGDARATQRSILARPDVTTQSFTGTIIFSSVRAFPDPSVKGAMDVSECFDNAHSANTSLSTGKIITDQVPASQHYYRNTDVVAPENGRWQVIAMYPVVYYPQAAECRP